MDIAKGVTELDWEVAQMKKAMVKSSKKLVSLTISKKLNTYNRFKVCDTIAVDTLITELEPNSPELQQYRSIGLDLL